MTKAIIAVLSAIAVFASMFLGIFAAAGLCAVIWGPSILDAALGDPPQRSHPAFITFMVVMVPAMLLGAAGGIAGILVPLYARFGIRCNGSVAVTKFMRGYATRILKVAGGNVDDDSPDRRAA